MNVPEFCSSHIHRARPFSTLLRTSAPTPWGIYGAFLDGTHAIQLSAWKLPFLWDKSWLVDGLEHAIYDFPFIGNVIIPTDELHDFSEG